MNTAQRREQIIALLKEQKSLKVTKLSQLFSVSHVTIRNDLKILEQEGCLIRQHGGASLNSQFVFEQPLITKGHTNLNQKLAIAQQAAALINDGDKIILDAGSTTTLMIPYLADKKQLVILTNALNIAYQLSLNTDAEIMIAGGTVCKNSFSVNSYYVEQFLRMYQFDKFFLGVDGFDLQAGLTTPNQNEAYLNRIMCEITDRIIVVSDSSKFNRKSFCRIIPLEGIDDVITDSKIPKEYCDFFDQHKIALTLTR